MNKNFLLRFFSSLLLGPLVIFAVYLDNYFFYLLLLVVIVPVIYETLKLKVKKIKIFIFFLLTMFTLSALQIYIMNNGKYLIIFILLLSWLSDIGGYIFGKFIGGKKIKIISPNKTYTGFIGSIVFVQFFGFYVKSLNISFINETVLSFYFLLICTLVVILGDLLFSYFKRRCEIKDFSNFLPGHGGLLDRIDGLMLLTIFVYIVKLWIL
jgi:phosphatidate cytidylyltransferase